MNHLKIAKEKAEYANMGIVRWEEHLPAIANALIAIAEQLEKMYDAEHMTDREFAIKYGEDK